MNSCANVLTVLNLLFRWIMRSRPSGSHTGWCALGLPLLVLAAWQPTTARADMWRYVDAQGVSHFSGAPLDRRYQLLFRGAGNFTAGTGKAAVGGASRASLGAAASPKQLTYFDVSPNYKAVKHLLREASETHGIDYELLQAVIATESGFNAQAVSPKGAVGLMQLIPPTAERYGVKADKDSPIKKKLTDPRTNLRAGSSYLSDLIKLFPGQLELAIAAYNAGEGAVQRAGNKIPNYPETINYVKTVMQLYTLLKPPAVGGVASSGRIRMEMMGGSPAAVLSSAAPEAQTVRD